MMLEQISGGRDPYSQRSQLQHPSLLPGPCHVHPIYPLSSKKRKGETFFSALWTYSIAEGAESSVSGGVEGVTLYLFSQLYYSH